MVYVIQVCWQPASRIGTELVPSRSCSQNLKYSLTACEQDRDGTSSVPILLAGCQQNCTAYTIAVCTVKGSCWWTEELSETCRVLFQKQIWEISVFVWFYYKNLSRCTVTWTSNSLKTLENVSFCNETNYISPYSNTDTVRGAFDRHDFGKLSLFPSSFKAILFGTLFWGHLIETDSEKKQKKFQMKYQDKSRTETFVFTTRSVILLKKTD